ncbi:hypothetical protein BKA61DRAFT_565640 [Leptodontidium sp. MPI-SDFR-AT-0119]|nr:hypothetical protein BKA61DRAFT_565640 [Leptodontidium sp. MPI-SDFR-AT-0119]
MSSNSNNKPYSTPIGHERTCDAIMSSNSNSSNDKPFFTHIKHERTPTRDIIMSCSSSSNGSSSSSSELYSIPIGQERALRRARRREFSERARQVLEASALKGDVPHADPAARGWTAVIIASYLEKTPAEQVRARKAADRAAEVIQTLPPTGNWTAETAAAALAWAATETDDLGLKAQFLHMRSSVASNAAALNCTLILDLLAIFPPPPPPEMPGHTNPAPSLREILLKEIQAITPL